MKELPSGGYLVPELTVAQPDGSEKVIPDSSAILRELDSLLPSSAESFFGDNAISEAEKHASTTINAFVLYFNHVSDDGWRRSIRQKAFSSVPFPIRYLIPYGALLGSVRARFREQVMREVGVEEDGLNDDAMRGKLVAELERYEEALKKSTSKYLYGTSSPSAADVSLYGMVARFVGNMGTAELPPCLPDLFEKGEGLKNLESWYKVMEKDLPFVWKRSLEADA